MTGFGPLRDDGVSQCNPKTSMPSHFEVREDSRSPKTRDLIVSTGRTNSDPRLRIVFPKEDASADKIRSRLLLTLGFDAASSSPEARTAKPASYKTARPRSVSFQEHLKADHGIPEDESDSSYGSHSVKRDSRRSVSFDSFVVVYPIPSRSDFSDRIRPMLWTPMAEMQENAARNCLEYASEGWDWRTVLDDDNMVVVNGERIHPIHFASSQCNVRRQFNTVMSVQQTQQI